MSDVPDTDILTERLISIIEAARSFSQQCDGAGLLEYRSRNCRNRAGGEGRTSYGDTVFKRIAERLYARFEGGGFSYPTVKRMKQFYVTYPSGSP